MEFVSSAKLPGVVLIKPEIFEDFRGDYVMVYNRDLYRANGIPDEFVEHCVSTSTRGVLRDIHVDFACNKVYEILFGRAYYVIVDCQKEAPT